MNQARLSRAKQRNENKIDETRGTALGESRVEQDQVSQRPATEGQIERYPG